MRLSTVIATLPAAAALLLAGGCAIHLGHWRDPSCFASADETIVVAAADFDALAVTTHRGSIHVESAAAGVDSVTIVAHKQAGGRDPSDADTALAALRVAHRGEGRTLTLQAEWLQEAPDRWEATVSFQITLPARFGVTLASHDGDVSVTGLAGPVAASSHHGDVDLLDLRGCVAASSHHGTVACATSGSQVALSSHHGDVRLRTSATAIDATLTSHHGDLELDLQSGMRGTIQGDGEFGGLDWRGSGGPTVLINGDDFELRFPDPAAGTITLSTHNGCVRVRCASP